MDSILQTIDRISSSTSFQGIKLLNGNFQFQTTGVVAGVTDYRVNSAKFTGAQLDINVLVTQSAQQGGLYLSTGANLDLTTGQAFVVEIAGAKGSRELTFSSGTSVANIATAINTFTDVTGVTAVASTTTGTAGGVVLKSTDFGSEQFVSVKIVSAAGLAQTGAGIVSFNSADNNTINAGSLLAFTSTNATNGIRDSGQDLSATINGIAATAKGKVARINTDFLDVSLSLNTTTAQTLGQVGGSGNPALTINGGGADFQLAGRVDIAGKVSIGVSDVSTRKLGNSTVGYLSSLASGKAFNITNGNLANAQQAVTEAISQVSSLRGRLGAFQKNTIGATVRSLGIAVENAQAADSVIRDADFASETANLTRSQILVQASTNVLALANSQPQSVLALLRG